MNQQKSFRTRLAFSSPAVRRILGSRFGRGWLPGMLVMLAVSGETAATAAPLMFFDSVQVTADGTNTTPVQIQVRVTNPDPTFNVTALDSQLSWTASGGASVGDLAVIEDSGVVTGTGFLFDGLSPTLASQGSNTPPVGWGVNVVSGSAAMANSTTYTVALINFVIAAGVQSGVFDVNFLTGDSDYNVFTDASQNAVLYANGNNGSTTGLITVVPEAGTAAMLLVGGVPVALLGLVRRARRLLRHQEPRN